MKWGSNVDCGASVERSWKPVRVFRQACVVMNFGHTLRVMGFREKQ